MKWRANPFAVDAWAVGVMLLELISGRLPQYDAAAQQLQSTTEPAWIGECLRAFMSECIKTLSLMMRAI